jgi:hypothetical protein
MTKYEALEKNAVSEPEMPQLENLQYSPIRRNGSLCWGIFGLSHGPQCKDRAMVAEGEELGSNLLHVLPRTRQQQIGGTRPWLLIKQYRAIFR